MQAMLVWVIGPKRFEAWLLKLAQAVLDAVSEGIDIDTQDELLARIRAALRKSMAELRAKEST